MRRLLRDRVTYANVMSTLAVFVALGGTSYALTLPRNSVGADQLRRDSVGRSELRRGAVRSAEIRDRTVKLRDVSASAQAALRGRQGPPGVPLFQSVNSGGELVTGNATSNEGAGPGGRLLGFERSVAGCVPVASITSLAGGPIPSPPPTSHVTAEPSGDGRILVKTYDANGDPAQYPFNLIVAC